MKVKNNINPGIISAAVMLLKPYVSELDEVKLVRALETYHAGMNIKETEVERPVPFDAAGVILNISRPTLLKYIKEKGLKKIRIGKRNFITAASLQRFLAYGEG